MEFDCIIMNPPYAKNLHLKILAEAIKHLRDDASKAVNLSPLRWLEDPAAEFKKGSDRLRFEDSVAKHVQDITAIPALESTELFNAALWSNLGIISCTKQLSDLYKTYAQKTCKAWPIVEKICLPLMRGSLEGVARIYDKFSENSHLPHCLKCSRVHGHPGMADENECITPKLELVLDKKGHEGREVYFQTQEEAVELFSTLQLPFYKCMKALKCWPADDFNKGLPWLGECINPRTKLKGYLGHWTEEDICKLFGISEDLVQEALK